MDLESARLLFADLSGAVNLTQGQIDKACGNAATKLPEGMHRPKHWLEAD